MKTDNGRSGGRGRDDVDPADPTMSSCSTLKVILASPANLPGDV